MLQIFKSLVFDRGYSRLILARGFTDNTVEDIRLDL